MERKTSVGQTSSVTEIRPVDFPSMSDFVLAVARRMRTIGAHDVSILRHYLGILDEDERMTLEETGRMLGVTRERVRQLASRMESALFSAEGIACFAGFVRDCRGVFAWNHGVIRSGTLVRELKALYPNWPHVSEKAVLRILGRCGLEIVQNGSGCMAWADGGFVARRYEIFLKLLNDDTIPLASLERESILLHAEDYGLDGMSGDEYLFFVHRALEENSHRKGAGKPRWGLFLRLRCEGMSVSNAERRRYVVSRALRAAGRRGLTHADIVDVCHAIDPQLDIGNEHVLEADASPQFKYDMDGTGVRLLIYDYGDKIRSRRFSLDVYFRDDALVRVVGNAGERLRRHMETNGVGVANITKMQRELAAGLHGKAAEGIPSACLYWLLREHKAGGLRYYDHPNVVHPWVLGERDPVPEMALCWVAYEYFRAAGRNSATWQELTDFCTEKLGMDPMIASSTVVLPIRGSEIVVDGEKRYELVPPVRTATPPRLLLGGGKIDSRISFFRQRNPMRLEIDAYGHARTFSTYVRLFLVALSHSNYVFSEEERRNFSNPGWCLSHLGVKRAFLVRAKENPERPGWSYWKEKCRFGGMSYWVSNVWNEKDKMMFDSWAVEMSRRAGFIFEPYDLRPTDEDIPPVCPAGAENNDLGEEGLDEKVAEAPVETESAFPIGSETPATTGEKKFVRAPRSNFTVVFPDGTVVSDARAGRVLAETIGKLGPARVEALGVLNSGEPLVSQDRSVFRKYPSNVVELGGGWFVNSHSSTAAKIACVKRIAQTLDVRLVIRDNQ